MARLRIKEFIDEAREGRLAACARCPRRPASRGLPLFGLSCPEHLSDGQAVAVLWLMEQPGPEVASTQRTCMIHNLRDETSRNALAVLRELGIGRAEWRLGESPRVVTGWYEALDGESRRRLRGIFTANAVFHGDAPQRREATFPVAQSTCLAPLRELIALTRPRCIVAFGKASAASLSLIESGAQLSEPYRALLDGRPRLTSGVPTFFAFHHSRQGLLNPPRWRIEPNDFWARMGAQIRATVGW